MDLLARLYRYVCDWIESSEATPPYPLCYDEWRRIEEAAEIQEQTQALQDLGLEASSDTWCVSDKKR